MTYRGFCPCFLVEKTFREFFFASKFGGTMYFDIMFFPASIGGSCRRIGSFITGKEPKTVIGKAERDEITGFAEEIIRTREMVSMERPILVKMNKNIYEPPVDPVSDVFSWKGRRI